MRLRIWLGMLVWAAFCYAPAAAEPFELPDRGTVPLLKYADVATGSPQAADVLAGNVEWVTYEPGLLTGWPVDAWLRFEPTEGPDARRIFLLRLPQTEWAELYAPQLDGHYQREVNGTSVAFDLRSAPYSPPSFRIDPSAALGRPFYLHVRYHPDLPFAPSLQDSQSFFRGELLSRLVFGLFIGVLLTLIGLGAYITFVVRYQAVGVFVIYLTALVVNELVVTDLGGEYFWPGLSFDPRLVVLLANVAAYASFLVFFRALLRTSEKVPVLDRALLGVFALQVVVMLLKYATPLGPALVQPLLGILLAETLLVLLIGAARWRQGSTTAPYFVYAFTPAVVGILANIAYDALLPAGNWIWAEYGVEFGVMLECSMMAIIVVNRIGAVHEKHRIVTHALTREEERNLVLQRLAHSDPLTGTANRASFYDALTLTLEEAQERHEMVGVLYLDLDDFKLVNDGRGHRAGDDLLRSVGNRLIALAREHDLVARLGGDEFAILLRNLPTATMLERIRERIMGSFEVSGLAASVGEGLYPRDGTTADELVAAADREMYRIKQERKALSARIAEV